MQNTIWRIELEIDRWNSNQITCQTSASGILWNSFSARFLKEFSHFYVDKWLSKYLHGKRANYNSPQSVLHNLYMVFETFFTVKFFLFLLKEFLRVLLLFCWYHLQDRFNFFPASCYRKATELWASASENCLIDGVGEDVVRRPNAGVLSARLIPAFAEVHMHILHILAPCLMYLRISSCGGTLWQDNRHIIGRNKYSLAWKK